MKDRLRDPLLVLLLVALVTTGTALSAASRSGGTAGTGARAAGAPGSGTAATARSRASGSTGSGHRYSHRVHGSHTQFGLGLYLGSPWYYYPYASYPYYGYWPYYDYGYGYWPYYGDAPYYGSTSVTWVEKQDFYWRYCVPLQTYYPYVKDCPNGEWQLVEPQPAPGSDQPAQSNDAPG